MPNTYFQFKQFRIEQARSGMKVTTDGCLFGGWVANEIRQANEPKRILDIGAGTGLLSLMLAQVTRDTEITAIEINEAAFNEAQTNFRQSPWKERLHCFNTSLQEHEDDTYDLIICNPPFFTNSQQGTDRNKNQAVHSSSLNITDLLDHTMRLLKSNGHLYLLYPEREMHVFTRLAITTGLYPQQQIIVRNQKNHPVFRMMAHFCRTKKQLSTTDLIIRNADRKYTHESWKLLKDYYLEYNNPEM